MTSIIAYRNPLEQWFWEGGALYVGAAIAVLLAAYWIAYSGKQLLCKHEHTWRKIDGTHQCRNCDMVMKELKS